MPAVDAELCWGDERLGWTHHDLNAELRVGGPFVPWRPYRRDGEDYVLTIPAQARAWIHTANGWRDFATLRVLGCLTPRPDQPGVAEVRLRAIDRARSLEPGVVVVTRVEAWLEVEGFWLRVGISDEAPRTPRLSRRAVRGTAGLIAATITLFTGVVSALSALPPRRATLDLSRLDAVPMTRLPPVRATPPERVRERFETKHDVDPRPAGGPEIADIEASVRAVRPRSRRGREGGQRDAGGRPDGLSRLGRGHRRDARDRRTQPLRSSQGISPGTQRG